MAKDEEFQWESYEDMMKRKKKEEEANKAKREESKRDTNHKIRDFVNGKK